MTTIVVQLDCPRDGCEVTAECDVTGSWSRQQYANSVEITVTSITCEACGEITGDARSILEAEAIAEVEWSLLGGE